MNLRLLSAKQGIDDCRKIGRAVRIERTEFDRWIRTQPEKIVVSEKGVPPLNTVAEKVTRSYVNEK